MQIRCNHCHYNFELAERCPHCGRPGLFPNVYMAKKDVEQKALNQRYEQALKEADKRSCGARIEEFEAILNQSKAVIAKNLNIIEPIASSDSAAYSTYYKLLDADVRLPSGDKWDVLRRVADTALFHEQYKNIRFAALTLDNKGLSNYGDCYMILKDDMIAHRASVFEENSILFMEHHDILVAETHNLPKGYKATWDERTKLCIAKLSGKIDKNTPKDDFPGILLKQGNTSADDEFVEVHIWGPITIRAVERIEFLGPKNKYKRARINDIKRKLQRYQLQVGMS